MCLTYSITACGFAKVKYRRDILLFFTVNEPVRKINLHSYRLHVWLNRLIGFGFGGFYGVPTPHRLYSTEDMFESVN